MNKEWSELNKTMQEQLKKEITFYEGLGTLLSLRNSLFSELLDMKKELNCEEFSAIPFLNADGYHSKTIAYSIWNMQKSILTTSILAMMVVEFIIG